MTTDMRHVTAPKSDLRKHYVYLHRKASDGQIFYIGKGKDRRAWARSGRNRHWKHVSEKHGHEVQILQDKMPEYCALTLERIVIAKVGISQLVNVVDGGGGTQGWKHSDETKKRIGEFHKGRKLTPKMWEALNRNRHAKLTEEHRKKLSLARTGKKIGPLSPETRAKISASHMGMKASPASRLKMSQSKIGKACGRNSPSYDHTIRLFIHADGAEFLGTRGDFIRTYNLANGCVSTLIKGHRKSVKGWKLK